MQNSAILPVLDREVCQIKDRCFVLQPENDHTDELDKSADLCQRLGLKTLRLEHMPTGAVYLASKNNLWSILINTKPPVELTPEYSSTRWQTHKLQQSYRQSPLHKALGRCGAGKVLDACAGFGRDSVILSALGYRVTACERNPIIFFLLSQAIKNGNFAHINLIQDDSIALLERSDEWHTIYLDPMFAHARKAQVKKHARILRAIVDNNDNDDIQLFYKARQTCRRLVVKRHIHAPALAGVSADIQYCGQSTRYDVYLQARTKVN